MRKKNSQNRTFKGFLNVVEPVTLAWCHPSSKFWIFWISVKNSQVVIISGKTIHTLDRSLLNIEKFVELKIKHNYTTWIHDPTISQLLLFKILGKIKKSFSQTDTDYQIFCTYDDPFYFNWFTSCGEPILPGYDKFIYLLTGSSITNSEKLLKISLLISSLEYIWTEEFGLGNLTSTNMLDTHKETYFTYKATGNWNMSMRLCYLFIMHLKDPVNDQFNSYLMKIYSCDCKEMFER